MTCFFWLTLNFREANTPHRVLLLSGSFDFRVILLPLNSTWNRNWWKVWPRAKCTALRNRIFEIERMFSLFTLFLNLSSFSVLFLFHFCCCCYYPFFVCFCSFVFFLFNWIFIYFSFFYFALFQNFSLKLSKLFCGANKFEVFVVDKVIHKIPPFSLLLLFFLYCRKHSHIWYFIKFT